MNSDRSEFEAFVLEWTGRDMAYHVRAETTGLDFAWACWQRAQAQGWMEFEEPAPIPEQGDLLLSA